MRPTTTSSQVQMGNTIMETIENKKCTNIETQDINVETLKWEKAREPTDPKLNHYIVEKNTLRDSEVATSSSSLSTDSYRVITLSLSHSLMGRFWPLRRR